MRKRLLAVTLSVMMTASMLAGCGGKADTKDTKKVQTEQDSSKEEGTAEESSEKKNAAEDAQKDGAELLQPTVDTVTYSDGTTEEVYGFDIPVTVIDQEFDLALIGKKGVWYDHKVSIENPVKDE